MCRCTFRNCGRRVSRQTAAVRLSQLQLMTNSSNTETLQRDPEVRVWGTTLRRSRWPLTPAVTLHANVFLPKMPFWYCVKRPPCLCASLRADELNAEKLVTVYVQGWNFMPSVHIFVTQPVVSVKRRVYQSSGSAHLLNNNHLLIWWCCGAC